VHLTTISSHLTTISSLVPQGEWLPCGRPDLLGWQPPAGGLWPDRACPVLQRADDLDREIAAAADDLDREIAAAAGASIEGTGGGGGGGGGAGLSLGAPAAARSSSSGGSGGSGSGGSRRKRLHEEG